MPDLDYKTTNSLVDPVSKVMKAAVELNWYAAEAYAAGWSIEFTISPELAVDVAVTRNQPWPASPDKWVVE